MAGSINYTALASGALGLTLALAWNDAVVKTIQSFFPPKDERGAARATLAYAIVVTILVIIVVAIINHTRRVVYGFKPGKPEKHEGRDSERGSEWRETARQGGFTPPIVQLWQPGAGA
jgi:hypothetical protein